MSDREKLEKAMAWAEMLIKGYEYNKKYAPDQIEEDSVDFIENISTLYDAVIEINHAKMADKYLGGGK